MSYLENNFFRNVFRFEFLTFFVDYLLKIKLKTKLQHITNIQTGIFAKTVASGEVVLLQAKHFNENGQLNSVLYPDLIMESTIESHLLRPGDILFAAKGTKNFATVYENKNAPAVASTSFFVIRLNETFQRKILPEFIAWFLNHSGTQKYLKGKAIGTSIASISKSVLEELEISIPDLQTQVSILKIADLSNSEKKIKIKLDMLREKQIQQQLIGAIK